MRRNKLVDLISPLWTRKKQLQRKPVVYQMGKVASTSTSKAIKSAGLPCYHIHTLDRQRIIDHAKYHLDSDRSPPKHLLTAMSKRNSLFLKTHECVYITLVRDPVARNLSAFFQNLDRITEKERAETDPRKMLETFLRAYEHSEPIEWFDREFKDQLGFDIFSSPFNIEKKYAYLDDFNTIIFRTDCPDKVKSRVLSEVLKRDVVVGQENVSAKKAYSQIYKAMQNISFPSEYLESMYSTKFSRHFWSPAELNDFRRFWSEPKDPKITESSVEW